MCAVCSCPTADRPSSAPLSQLWKSANPLVPECPAFLVPGLAASQPSSRQSCLQHALLQIFMGLLPHWLREGIPGLLRFFILATTVLPMIASRVLCAIC